MAGLDADLEARISLAVSTGRLDLSECGMFSFPLHHMLTFDLILFIFLNAASFKTPNFLNSQIPMPNN
jgi:hypothetical protein